jgi:hypothetical protein
MLRRLIARLRTLCRSRNRQEAFDAIAEAERSIAEGRAREPEIQWINERLHAHGRENHFGSRIYEAATRKG